MRARDVNSPKGSTGHHLALTGSTLTSQATVAYTNGSALRTYHGALFTNSQSHVTKWRVQ